MKYQQGLAKSEKKDSITNPNPQKKKLFESQIRILLEIWNQITNLNPRLKKGFVMKIIEYFFLFFKFCFLDEINSYFRNCRQKMKMELLLMGEKLFFFKIIHNFFLKFSIISHMFTYLLFQNSQKIYQRRIQYSFSFYSRTVI